MAKIDERHGRGHGVAAGILGAFLFLGVLLAAYAASREAATALGPLDRWIDVHVIEPSRGEGG